LQTLAACETLPETTRRQETVLNDKQIDSGPAASAFIDEKIAGLHDWRGQTLAGIRALIHEADPEVIEEIKWRKPSNPSGVALWSHAGILCTGEIYKDKVKLTFAKGAALADPSGLFNASLDGNARRALDIREGDEIDAKAFKDIIRAAVTLNTAGVDPVCTR
jgi:hypothetical protein